MKAIGLKPRWLFAFLKALIMAISKEVWDKAQALYELGDSLSRIADKTGIEKSSISKRAKKEQWVQGEIQQLKNEKINAVNALINVEEKINTQIQPLKREILDQEVLSAIDIKIYATNTQARILQIMRKAAAAGEKLVADNPNGWYIKKQDGKGTTFGLVTEVIPHLAPILAGATNITKDDKPQAAIQINNTQTTIIPDNPMDAARAYQELMQGE